MCGRGGGGGGGGGDDGGGCGGGGDDDDGGDGGESGQSESECQSECVGGESECVSMRMRASVRVWEESKGEDEREWW